MSCLRDDMSLISEMMCPVSGKVMSHLWTVMYCLWHDMMFSAMICPATGIICLGTGQLCLVSGMIFCLWNYISSLCNEEPISEILYPAGQ